MKRREFIAGLGSAAAWPLVARAQQGDRVRRIGVLMFFAADDPESQARLTAFRQALQELGWTDGRNVLIEYRWSAADVDRARKEAAELIALAPDVILANASVAVTGLQQVARTVPIVFVNVVDPLVARHRLPAIYNAHYFVTAGGVISYGPDTTDSFRRAAGYVDRILRGERPADMPVQAPTKNELVINLKTAKALGLTIPETLLATADEVIQ
jgi:ABC-type uncharacterized transport system substrate-binding protein